MTLVSLVMISALGAADVPTSEPVRVRLTPLRGPHERFRYEGKVPEGFELVREPRRGLLVPGATIFGVSYLVTAVLMGLSQPVFGPGFAPVGGPFALAAQSTNPLASSGILFLTLGFAQVAGLVMAMLGVALPSEWLMRQPGAEVR